MDERGKPVAALDSRPILYDHNVVYWRSWLDLRNSRQSGFGIGHIPVTEVVAYMDLIDVEQDERLHFLRMVNALDRRFVELANEKAEKDRKSKQPSDKVRKAANRHR